ncbi:MAG: biopolymer transporter ExbD [Candidatus Cloacimonetes bacterium]|nr:biopolymer transporter ExbD [Candidatus Cloacimonadota bacterium]
MNLNSEYRKSSSAIINITSLIDVVLLLLIFFMLTTRFVEQPGMKLDLPSSQSGDSNLKEENTITVTAQGVINLNNAPVELADLQMKLSSLIDSTSTENAITLKADRTIDYGTVIKVMDSTRLAGFQKLIIATEKVNGK